MGGSKDSRATAPDSEYVEYEMAAMFGALLNYYGYSNSGIYVNNLSGIRDHDSSYYDYFLDYAATVNNYHSAKPDSLKETFQELNGKLNSNDKNVLLIFMCGHRGKSPQGTRHFYRFYKKDDRPDSLFAQSVKNDLLEHTYDVNSKTRIVFVAGFCTCYGFWDGSSSYDELKDVCDYITFAAADTALGDDGVAAGPQNSFMRYWKDIVKDSVGITIHTAFDSAKSSYLADPNHGNDLPIKQRKHLHGTQIGHFMANL